MPAPPAGPVEPGPGPPPRGRWCAECAGQADPYRGRSTARGCRTGRSTIRRQAMRRRSIGSRNQHRARRPDPGRLQCPRAPTAWSGSRLRCHTTTRGSASRTYRPLADVVAQVTSVKWAFENGAAVLGRVAEPAEQLPSPVLPPGHRAGQVDAVRAAAGVPRPPADPEAPRREPALGEVEAEGANLDGTAEQQSHRRLRSSGDLAPLS